MLPVTFDDLTPSWFSDILGVQVNPKTFKTAPNAQAGMGFLSMLVRVEFEAETPGNGTTTPKKYNLIVKLLPDEHSFLDGARDIIVEDKIDRLEVNTYRYLLPDLIHEIPELEKYICKLYFAGIQEEDIRTKTPYTSVLVLEDLRPLGYTTKLYNETIREQEFAQGLDFLASMHAASKSLEHRKGMKIPEIYPWFRNWLDPAAEGKGSGSSMFSYFPAGFQAVYKFLEEQGKSELMQQYKNIEPRVTNIDEGVLLAARDHACLIHTDMWSHNVLVNDDLEKPVKVVDWQLIAYADPMFDLAIFVLSTLPKESMNPAGISKAFGTYYKRYTELCTEKKVPVGRTLVEMENFLMTYGLSFALGWFVLTAIAATSIPNSGEKLIRALELFVELGTTDFLYAVT